MTDNEIIKAFEHCVYSKRGYKCRECEYVTGCKSYLMREALALINRQKAEISVKRKLLAKAEAKFEAYEMDKAQLESDIINATMNLEHVQKEVERLEAENEKQRVVLEAIDDHFMPLPFETDYDKAIKTAKAEAVKEIERELADRLTDVAVLKDNGDGTERLFVSTSNIRKILKEMAGEQECTKRANAVKEFAERLKEKSRYPMGTIYVEHIDNLVKEFTEGEGK